MCIAMVLACVWGICDGAMKGDLYWRYALVKWGGGDILHM